MNKTSSVTITTEDVVNTLLCNSTCNTLPRLSFSTSSDLRIKISFLDFSFGGPGEYLKIGDGLIVDHATRLALFSGIAIPSDVVSVMNGAWVNVKISCGIRRFVLNMTVTAEEKAGI